MDEIAFTKVKLPYGWLGNMAPYPLVFKTEVYKTSEALFQALRFADPSPNEISERRALVRAEIMLASSPMGAKMIAKRNIGLMTVNPRSPKDVENMADILRIKLLQHTKLMPMLLATGDATIIEDCTARANLSGLFWGASRGNGIWEGENTLGKLWMEIRAELNAANPWKELN